MATKTWRIEEFHGIDQSRDGALCNEGTSPMAYNMDTSGGNLSVAKGYVRHIDKPVPGNGPVRRLIVKPLMDKMAYAVIAADDKHCMHLYAFDDGMQAWNSVFEYPSDVKGDCWDILQCGIGSQDYLLLACGEHQMIKWDGNSASASLFGSGEALLKTTVAAYASQVVTLKDAISADAEACILRTGISINGLMYAAQGVDRAAKKVTLKSAPAINPAVGDAVKAGGGLSDAHVNYLAMHFSRLFAAGDPMHPSRLYYSQIAGDGRSMENWSVDEASPNTGGGTIEIGDSAGDPIMGLVALSTQLLIVKRYSIYRLLGDRPSNYTVERVDSEVEKLTHTAVTMHADVAFYLTTSGLSYFNNVTAQQMPDARSIKGFMETCDVSQCKACCAKDVLYFSCYQGARADARTYDNHVIAFDLRRRTYMLRNGFEIADMVAVDGVIYMINGTRRVYRWNEGADYDGVPIAASWLTQRTDWQSRAIDKKVEELFLRGMCESLHKTGAAMLLTTRFGDREQVFRALVRDNPEEMLEIRPDSDWARTFQFRIENEAGSRFVLHGGMEAMIQVKERAR